MLANKGNWINKGCLFWSAVFLSTSFLFPDFCHIIASNIIFPKMICRKNKGFINSVSIISAS
jgi:hypothetical protein